MSGRSLLLSAVAVVACGKKAADPPKPTADPAKVRALAAQMIHNTPVMAAVPVCKDTDFAGAVTVTSRTLEVLAQEPVPKDPEHAEWINPPSLESPAMRVIATADATSQPAREAAAELLAAKTWLVYRVEMVNAPLALAVRELKIGTVGTRLIVYDNKGVPTCARPFYFQNDKAKSDWAIANADHAVIPPEIVQAMKDDLAAQFVKLAPKPTPVAAATADKH
jgi:hypothetical protein